MAFRYPAPIFAIFGLAACLSTLIGVCGIELVVSMISKTESVQSHPLSLMLINLPGVWLSLLILCPITLQVRRYKILNDMKPEGSLKP